MPVKVYTNKVVQFLPQFGPFKRYFTYQNGQTVKKTKIFTASRLLWTRMRQKLGIKTRFTRTELFSTWMKNAEERMKQMIAKTLFLVFMNSRTMEARRNFVYSRTKNHECAKIHEFTNKFFNFHEFANNIYVFSRISNEIVFTNSRTIFSFSRIHDKANSRLPEHRWGNLCYSGNRLSLLGNFLKMKTMVVILWKLSA